MLDHGCDGGHNQPEKAFVHLNKNSHDHDDDHSQAMKVLEVKDKDEGSQLASNHSRDKHHNLAITHHHNCNQGCGQAIKLFEVQLQNRRDHHDRDGYSKEEIACFEDFTIVSTSKLAS